MKITQKSILTYIINDILDMVVRGRETIGKGLLIGLWHKVKARGGPLRANYVYDRRH